MEKAYIIYESELVELIHDSLQLHALDRYGLNNWEWYYLSINEYEKENGELYELAQSLAKENFLEVKE